MEILKKIEDLAEPTKFPNQPEVPWLMGVSAETSNHPSRPALIPHLIVKAPMDLVESLEPT